ncbi:MAG: hypothetical protein JNL69_01590 [Bacteroidia bacterium]|nr:hypothetical protein [Bacteroidia bacterium]
MQKKHFIASFLFITIALNSIAQNDIDALRYSQLTFVGTARFASMAGSMGALGGDVSTFSFNPAGVGVYRKTELVLSPSVYSQTVTSTFNNNTTSDNKLNFNFGSLGLAATFKLNEEKANGWQTFNFGLSYNRINNFHSRSLVEAYNKESSLLDTYVADANGHSPDDFDSFTTGLAWNTWLVNPNSGDSTHYNHVIKNYGQLQRKSTLAKGAMYETAITFGGNYLNKLFVGATIGIVKAKYAEEYVYEELDAKDTIAGFKSFSFTNTLNTEGRGVNFKVGAIFMPVDWLRVGAAVHTPTSISLTDDYKSSMKSDLENNIKYEEQSPVGAFNYSVTTPFRAIGSLGFIIKKIAIVNVDYEYVDYKNAKLSSRPNVFAEVNNTIRQKYTSATNLRAGAEFRLDPFAIRIGYALYGSPFKAGENKNATRSSYTAGVGYRTNHYFIDFAYVYTMSNQNDYLYNPEFVKATENKITNASFMLTFGLRF